MRIYQENDQVTIVNLGDGKEYRAIVRGLSVEGFSSIYILEMVDKLDPKTYPYSHCTVPEAWLRPGWPHHELDSDATGYKSLGI